MSKIKKIDDQAEDLLSNMTDEQLKDIRRRVKSGIAAIEAGRFTEYEGREGLRILAEKVKRSGRSRLKKKALSTRAK